MRPVALKFLKHLPRGLKHHGHGKGMHDMSILPAMSKMQKAMEGEGVKRIHPLKFKR